MAQVSYGTITITDTTDLTTYIRYATKAPLTAASQFQETPTIDTHYIAVLSIPTSDSIPAWNSSSWKWSEFIGTDGLSVKDTRVLYYLKTNSANVPQVDYNTSIVSTDVQNAWTSKNPTYVANGTYWTCLEVILSNNTTKSWSAPAEDLGLTQMAKDTAEAKSLATQVDTLLGGHFMWHGTALSSLTSVGARVVEQIKNGTTDVSSTPSQWRHNVNIGSNGIQLRYNEAIMAQLAATNQNSSNIALKFYQPPSISGSTTTQGNLTMELSGNALKFYNTSGTITSTFGDSISLASNGAAITIGSTSTGKYNTYIDTQGLYLRTGTTSYATLNSNGLTLNKGGIRVDTVGSNNGVYISSENLGTSIALDNNNRTNWRAVIGSKFGVDSEGNLYASNVNISGTITIIGSDSNIYTKEEVSSAIEPVSESVSELSLLTEKTYYAYASDLNGTDFSTTNTNLQYRGLYVTTDDEQSTEYTDYIWELNVEWARRYADKFLHETNSGMSIYDDVFDSGTYAELSAVALSFYLDNVQQMKVGYESTIEDYGVISENHIALGSGAGVKFDNYGHDDTGARGRFVWEIRNNGHLSLKLY